MADFRALLIDLDGGLRRWPPEANVAGAAASASPATSASAPPTCASTWSAAGSWRRARTRSGIFCGIPPSSGQIARIRKGGRRRLPPARKIDDRVDDRL